LKNLFVNYMMGVSFLTLVISLAPSRFSILPFFKLYNLKHFYIGALLPHPRVGALHVLARDFPLKTV